MDPRKDYYAVLGVDPTSSVGQLRAAWRTLVEHHHPDRWTQHGAERTREATRRTQEINEAWQVLSDGDGRLQYDRLRTLRLLEAVGWRPPVVRPASRGNGKPVSLVDFEPPPAPAPEPEAAPPQSNGAAHSDGVHRATAVAAIAAIRESGTGDGPPRRTPWGPRAVLGVLGLAVVAQLIVGAIAIGVAAAIVDGELALDEPAGIMALLIATAVWDYTLVMFAWGFGPRRFRLGFRGLGFRGFGTREAGYALAGILAAWGILLAYGVLIQVTGLDGLQPESALEDDLFSQPATIIMGAIATVLVAPVAEEAFFRGFVFAGLLPRWGFWPAAAVSGALFSLAHADLGSLLPFALVGMVFAWLYYRTNTIWTAVAMHFAFNLISYSIAVAVEAG